MLLSACDHSSASENVQRCMDEWTENYKVRCCQQFCLFRFNFTSESKLMSDGLKLKDLTLLEG